MIWVLASMPVLRAFMEERALPSGERGPVDLSALRRLASICFLDGIERRIAGGQRVAGGARGYVDETKANLVLRLL
jgi:hypothetical protein